MDMIRFKIFRFPTTVFATAIVVSTLMLFPALSCGQGGGRDAISTFPADTQQLVYSNLAQLRALPDYPQIRQLLFTQQLRTLEDSLRSMGTDPEKDVDEVTLGWRGDPSSTAFFGLAEGRLQPDHVHDYVIQHQLPYQQYAGYDLYPSNSGQDHSALFFVFFDSSSAAFGRLTDLKAMLDVREGTHPSVNSIAEFADGESELEGTAPQWGIARGAAAANQAAPWLTGGAKLPADPKVFLSTVQWVLYRFDWASGFSMHMSILCQNSEGASNLEKILTFVRAVRPSTSASASAAAGALFQGMEIHTNDSRVEVSASVPMETAEQIFRNGGSPATP